MKKKVKKHLETCATSYHWSKIGIKHHHGICLAVFSLKSKTSLGIGEFLDLLPMIDFVKKIKMDTIQLLPINECGKDPSPYNAFSSCALHPIYLKFSALPYLNKTLREKFKNFTLYKNLKSVNYEKVRRLKHNWLLKYFKENFKYFENDVHFQRFVKNNSWLHPYAVFHILRKKFKEKNWFYWPKKFQDITEEKLSAILRENQFDANFHYLAQFLCYSQMMEVKNYATKKKIFIKGDIPILLNRNSVDVWYERHLFDLNHVAGCPPDDTSPLGQKWGFPLYNWDSMRAHNFDWWKRRLSLATTCYHIYRIDHVVGFFRIWAILPKDKSQHGKFLPKHYYQWKGQGQELLNMMIDSSIMLPIAEDLGLIPKMTYESEIELGICGTKVMRWQKKRKKFVNIKDYEPISLTCVSTHDFPTLTLWWKDYPEEAKEYCKFRKWKFTKNLSEKHRFGLLHNAHHSASLFHINLLQEYLGFFDELVWKNPNDERINISGMKNNKNWKYRFKPSVEELLENKKLIDVMKRLIK